LKTYVFPSWVNCVQACCVRMFTRTNLTFPADKKLFLLISGALAPPRRGLEDMLINCVCDGGNMWQEIGTQDVLGMSRKSRK
jgi:hypothetical protein